MLSLIEVKEMITYLDKNEVSLVNIKAEVSSMNVEISRICDKDINELYELIIYCTKKRQIVQMVMGLNQQLRAFDDYPVLFPVELLTPAQFDFLLDLDFQLDDEQQEIDNLN